MKNIKDLPPAAIVLTSASLLLTGLAVGLAVAPTPSSCIEALEASDTLQKHSVEGFGLASQAIDYAVSWNVSGLERVGDELGTVASNVTDTKADYDTAADKCGGEDR